MTASNIPNPNIILPIGTTIVLLDDAIQNGQIGKRAGSVGVVQESPVDNTHSYRVRFPDGSIMSLKRGQFAVQKHYRREGMERDVLAERDLYDFVIYRCITGSRAYGLDHAESDIDLRGIYLPPASLQWSLYGVPEQLEQGEEVYWELQKFLTLALKANPNILECLYTEKVEYASDLAQDLLAQRQIFLSKLLYQTYNGYVISQFKKLNQHIRNHGTIKWKHAMHLIRLLLAGITALNEGVIVVDVGEHRQALLDIRHERVSWDEVNAWRLDLHQQLDAAYQTTKLPDRPDYDAANVFLVKARQAMVDG